MRATRASDTRVTQLWFVFATNEAAWKQLHFRPFYYIVVPLYFLSMALCWARRALMSLRSIPTSHLSVEPALAHLEPLSNQENEPCFF